MDWRGVGEEEAHIKQILLERKTFFHARYYLHVKQTQQSNDPNGYRFLCTNVDGLREERDSISMMWGFHIRDRMITRVYNDCN